MFINGIFVKCRLWERRFVLQCKLGLDENALRSYRCQFLPLHTLEFSICGARTRISSSSFTFVITILQGALKVLDVSGSNLVLMFLMFGHINKELTLPLVKLWRSKKLASSCSKGNIWHINDSLAIMRLLLHKCKTFPNHLTLRSTSTKIVSHKFRHL